MPSFIRMAALVAMQLVFSTSHAQHPASASNMNLVGYNDLQARSAYQPVVHAQGGPERKSAYIAYHAAESMPGYDVAFQILDTIIRQLSEDTVKVGSAGSPRIVDGIARA